MGQDREEVEEATLNVTTLGDPGDGLDAEGMEGEDECRDGGPPGQGRVSAPILISPPSSRSS